ncbi:MULTISPECIES: DUF3231 family protein [unclassified Niallia]|uniref:DUF3231 family protein n=1 Tax=unclassified Niallia TaxID=2837522 RepID=UPI001EDA9CD0|nr:MULTISPECIES: DUF3231 family protein [unclassified Niallia]MCM3033169.1 DUF3231 family protein [Niallia sp. MER 6]UPO90379.1 DUF3231 family protein [Niallia sp. Man26]
MGILSGNPKDEPLHYGEVYDIWSSVFGANGMIGSYQIMKNHTGDDELKELLDEAVNLCKKQKEQLEKILKENGIGLPPSMPEPPEACLEDIPVGARLPDPAVASALSLDLAAGLVLMSQIMAKAIREDVGMMYEQFHTQKTALAAKVLRLNKDKGWLVPPPLHVIKQGDC